MKKHLQLIVTWLALAIVVIVVVLLLNFQYFNSQIAQAEKLTHAEMTEPAALDLDLTGLKAQIEAEERLKKLEKFEAWPVEINVENLGTQGNPFIVTSVE